MRHFLDLSEIPGESLRAILTRARALKDARGGRPRGTIDDGAPLAGRILALIFERNSTRTRVSFEVGMRQLGGEVLTLSGDAMQLGRGETIADTARVMSRYVDAIMIRTTSHDKLLELAKFSSVPVINGLTDYNHPCQIMADILTFEEHRGPIAGKTIAWSGDGNNVAVSWVHAAAKFGFTLRLATPPGYEAPAEVLKRASAQGGAIEICRDPLDAVQGADCVVTDTWVSMGANDAETRKKALTPYRVTAELMAAAARDALFMHCLPAHRGDEVSAKVIDGPQSVVWDEAENRLHAQKAVLLWCLEA
jgi:ornithine carbamoyltransferase